MTSSDWERIRAIIEDALDRAPTERPGFIAQACAGDGALQREVEQYLGYEEIADRALAITAWLEQPEEEPAALADPERLGPYRIVQRIGEGGMGVVYLAERADGEYTQRVAVKILKPGPQRARMLELFRQERQILARLDHPNIAHLLDGGTQAGQIYCVMEYVEGHPITAYCHERNLTLRSRLELFCRVCDAVSHAHRKLVIHRDLKPGNILVTAEGAPKLLDFGLARMFEDDSSSQPTLTMAQMLTPAYASPEQIRGEHLSTATDVFSLGVLLYELLTGRNPHRRGDVSPIEVCRVICEEEAPLPSRTVDRALRRQIAGDLDSIVLMALRKEPDLRYSSVEELRADVEHYLGKFPVHARRGTTWYRCRKYVGRHRWGLAVSAVGAVAAVVAGILIWWNGHLAQMRFNDVRSLAHAVIFELHDAIQDLPGSTSARKLLVDRALQYLRKLEASAGGNRELQLELAAGYQKIGIVQGRKGGSHLGDTAGAIASLLKARQLFERAIGSGASNLEAQRSLVAVYLQLAGLYEQRGQEAERIDISRRAADLQSKIAREHPESRKQKALAYHLAAANLMMVSRWKEAAPTWRQVIGEYQAAAAQDPKDIEIPSVLSAAHEELARCCQETGDLPCAREQYIAALAIWLPRSAKNSSATLRAAFNLIDAAWVEHRMLRHRDALAHAAQSIVLLQQLADADPRDLGARLEVAKALLTQARIAAAAGETDQAVTILGRSIAVFDAALVQDPGNQSAIYHAAAARTELAGIHWLHNNWRAADKEFHQAAVMCGRLRVGGKLEGFLDPNELKRSISVGAAKCRRRIKRSVASW